MLKKKIWASFQIIKELFTRKIVTKLSKIWVWDPGSEILEPGFGKNRFRIPDPQVKKAPDLGSGSATLCPGIQNRYRSGSGRQENTFVSGFYSVCVQVLMAVGVCAAVVFALTLFALQSKYDFTAWGGEISFPVSSPWHR
jgi:hypothetical protein